VAWQTRKTYQQISQQHSNRNLANRRHVNRRLLLDLWGKIPLTAEINARRPISHELEGDFEFLARHPANHHIAERQAVFQRPPWLLYDLVSSFPEAGSTGEFLNIGDVDTIHSRAVICQQRGQWPAYNLTPIDNRNGAAMQSVPIRQNGVVDTEVL